MKPTEPLEFGRRKFIATAVGAAAAAAAAFSASSPARAGKKSGGPSLSILIDTHVYLGRWPFRRLPLDETAALVAKLRGQGVRQAWAGSFDALLHKDITEVNAHLASECHKFGEGILVPIGALDPMQSDWEEDLRRCADEHHMPGIRLHPNYHGYKLSDPVFERVLKLADERGLFVQIAVIMEDERTIHPLVNVPPTDTAPLPALARKFPRIRLQLLNAFRTVHAVALIELASAGVRFEIAMLEGAAGVGNLLAQIDADRLLFGSYAPFFYFESAWLKLQESALTAAQTMAISEGNARQFLAPR